MAVVGIERLRRLEMSGGLGGAAGQQAGPAGVAIGLREFVAVGVVRRLHEIVARNVEPALDGDEGFAIGVARGRRFANFQEQVGELGQVVLEPAVSILACSAPAR